MVICKQLLLVVINNRKGFWRAKLPRFDTKPSNCCNIQIVIKSQPYRWFATIPLRFKQQRPWRPCWMTGTIELIIILLLMVIQHGGDDVSCKRSIRHWSENWCPGYLKHALSSSEIHFTVAKSLEIIGHVTNCCKRPIHYFHS